MSGTGVLQAGVHLWLLMDRAILCSSLMLFNLQSRPTLPTLHLLPRSPVAPSLTVVTVHLLLSHTAVKRNLTPVDKGPGIQVTYNTMIVAVLPDG